MPNAAHASTGTQHCDGYEPASFDYKPKILILVVEKKNINKTPLQNNLLSQIIIKILMIQKSKKCYNPKEKILKRTSTTIESHF